MREIKLLRKIGIAEGYSFVVLLFIAMPLKYMYQMPMAVKYTGWAHGFLFVAYLSLAYYVKVLNNQPFRRVIYALLAALIPFGAFVYDRQLKKELNH